MLGLGIETSCDETAAAVVRDGVEILSNAVYSQTDEHAPFRGVVPEIASRAHLEKINYIYAKALDDANVKAQDIDFAAVTNRPGLTGSLMIGSQLAKTFGYIYKKPVIPVDHVEAHLYASRLEGINWSYPYLGLLLSGGNSAVFKVLAPGNLEVVGDTRDDALGEAFDKTAAILNLEYPGGPAVEKRAALAEGPSGLFARILRDLPEDSVEFSFSGIKTAVLRSAARGLDVNQICRDFQDTVFELVERMLLRASVKTGIRRIIASGGVLANTVLQSRLYSLAGTRNLEIHCPRQKILCTDNAAMVASLGYFLMKGGFGDDKSFPVSSNRIPVTP